MIYGDKLRHHSKTQQIFQLFNLQWYKWIYTVQLGAFKTKTLTCLQQQGRAEEGSHREGKSSLLVRSSTCADRLSLELRLLKQAVQSTSSQILAVSSRKAYSSLSLEEAKKAKMNSPCSPLHPWIPDSCQREATVPSDTVFSATGSSAVMQHTKIRDVVIFNI